MAKAFKKQALGRGLSALLQDSKVGDNSLGVENNSTQIGTIVELELDFIEVNPFQPRTQFKEETIRELASSIQELGVIQPITVRETKANTFQLVSGERRFRASKLLDFKTIPAYIRVANEDSVIIPIQCEYFALEGLGKLLNTIKSVQKIHNEQLDIEGLLLTMYDSRLRLSNQVVEEVQSHFTNMVFKTIIQRNVRLSEAPSHGESIIYYDVNSKGATNYLSLAKEIISKQ